VRKSSVARAVHILDLLTTHPGRGFSLSELSRELGISKSTVHGILRDLTHDALVVRNPITNEYRSGPALVAMGSVAERSLPALTHAKHEAARLADEYEAEMVIVMATDDELLILGHYGVPRMQSVMFREGQRHPLMPPMGAAALAWRGDRAIEAWLDRHDPELSEAERDRYRAGLATIRRRGFFVGVLVPALEHLHDLYATGDVYSPVGQLEIGRALTALAHDEYLPASDDVPPDAQLSAVSAPVFGPDGRMQFAITLIPDEAHRARDIPTLSRAVLRAAGRVMAATDGRHPSGGMIRSADGPALAGVNRPR
jgi:DNA-binding IclR family transcriptional regulator